MTFRVGDSVFNADFGAGIVIDTQPDGYVVARRDHGRALTESQTFRAAELQPGPALPEFEVGTRVHLHAGHGKIIAIEDGVYTVEIERPRKNFTFAHVYRAHAWEIALGGVA